MVVCCSDAAHRKALLSWLSEGASIPAILAIWCLPGFLALHVRLCPLCECLRLRTFNYSAPSTLRPSQEISPHPGGQALRFA